MSMCPRQLSLLQLTVSSFLSFMSLVVSFSRVLSFKTTMEKLRRVVNEIAYTHPHHFSNLPPLHRSLIPILSFASSLYKLVLSLRHTLYHYGVFSKRQLPLPVISVGNLTWGGNGKTPMVEYIATWLADFGISPLILTRGYGGGDEVRMLQRHLLGKSVKIGVGADRAATATTFIAKYGCSYPRVKSCSKRVISDEKVGSYDRSEGIGAVVLDDGTQHWRLRRDVDIVMVNALRPWGNGRLLPVGPLREPLTALRRADIVVVHHTDLVNKQRVQDIEFMIHEVKESIPIFFTRMSPEYLFEVQNNTATLPLGALSESVVLCVSAIGTADAFVQVIEKLGACFVDRINFSDHHLFQLEDVEIIKMRLAKLEREFASRPIAIVTEKDYDRDQEILMHLQPFKVWVLHAELQFVPYNGSTENSFLRLLKELLMIK